MHTCKPVLIVKVPYHSTSMPNSGSIPSTMCSLGLLRVEGSTTLSSKETRVDMYMEPRISWNRMDDPAVLD